MKPIDFKEWTEVHKEYVYLGLVAYANELKEHPIVSEKSPMIVWRKLFTGELRAAIIDGYLLVYDFGASWCSEENILYELLLRRVMPGGSFPELTSGMHDLAKEHGCVGIMTGNGVLRPGLERQYLRRGFSKINEAYYKEV